MQKLMVFLSIIVGVISAQQLELEMPVGLLKVTLKDDAQYLLDEEQLNSAVLIQNIEARLDHLEEICMVKSKKSDCLTLELLLNEIRFLLGLFPKNYYVIITPYLPAPEPPPIFPMSDVDFVILLHRLKPEHFADEKLNMLRTAAGSNYFLIEQVEKILDLFSFEDDRLSAVRILYPVVLDTENSFRLYSKFEFSDSKEEFKQILQ